MVELTTTTRLNGEELNKGINTMPSPARFGHVLESMR